MLDGRLARPGIHRYREGRNDIRLFASFSAVLRLIVLDAERSHENAGAVSANVLTTTPSFACSSASIFKFSCPIAAMGNTIAQYLNPARIARGVHTC